MNKWISDEIIKSKYNPIWLSGSFGKISYLNKISGNICSIRYTRTRNNLYELPLEPTVLWNLRNCHQVVKILEYYNCIDGYIQVYECFGDSTLDEYLFKFGSLSDSNCRIIMNQLKNLIDYLKIFKIFNPDFSCKNLQLNTKTFNIKMYKFKYATCWHENLYTYLLLDCVNPPEAYLFEFYKIETFVTWQLGNILYHMITGQMAFKTEKEVIYNKILFLNPNISLIARDLIENSLCKLPELRMKLQHFFNHVWFNVGY